MPIITKKVIETRIVWSVPGNLTGNMTAVIRDCVVTFENYPTGPNNKWQMEQWVNSDPEGFKNFTVAIAEAIKEQQTLMKMTNP